VLLLPGPQVPQQLVLHEPAKQGLRSHSLVVQGQVLAEQGQGQGQEQN
jgi:hypothetical protein